MSMLVYQREKVACVLKNSNPMEISRDFERFPALKTCDFPDSHLATLSITTSRLDRQVKRKLRCTKREVKSKAFLSKLRESQSWVPTSRYNSFLARTLGGVDLQLTRRSSAGIASRGRTSREMRSKTTTCEFDETTSLEFDSHDEAVRAECPSFH